MSVHTPLQSIRKFCLWCCLNSAKEVKLCNSYEGFPKCVLWPLRFAKGVKGISPLKTIRAKCLDCSNDSYKEVTNCKNTDCSLFSYRTGHNPKLKGKRGRKKEDLIAIGFRNKLSLKKNTEHKPVFELKRKGKSNG